MNEETKHEIVNITILLMLLGIFVYFSISAFTTPSFNFLVIFPFIFLILLVFMQFNEYMVVVHQPKFHFKTGVFGTLQGSINYHSNGIFTCHVWIKTRIINKLNKDKIVRVYGSSSTWFGHFTGNTLVEISGLSNKLKDRTGKMSELPEGSFYYEGSISGVEIISDYEELEQEVFYTRNLISIIQTVKSKMTSIASIMAQTDNKEMKEASKQINMMAKEIIDASKPIIYTGMPQTQLPNIKQ